MILLLSACAPRAGPRPPGRGAGKSDSTAAPTWQELVAQCRAGFAETCPAAGDGFFYLRSPEYTLAADLYAEGCRLRDARSCLRLGLVAEWGMGAEPDPASAERHYRFACERRVPGACESVARLAAREDVLRRHACPPQDPAVVPSDAGAAADAASPPDAGTRGGLDKDVIARVIRANQEQIRYCYERALAHRSHLAGKVAVHWVIGPDGRIASVGVDSSTLGDPDTEACIVGRIQTWRFPCPMGGGHVTVTFPWIFQPAESP